ncbi:MAG: MCE family protein [Betaproteobacteria bacterium]|nr:MCE family protein [Betaproteobacteria bacterium]
MENKAYAFAAGVFTLLLVAGVVFAAMWLTGETEARYRYVLETRHPVTGLTLQAPVRYRGVDVGKVEGIDFNERDPRTILIRVAVRTETPVTKGTYAQLASQGVTGLAFVLLDDDGSSPERLLPARDARIPVRQSFFDELSGAGTSLMSDVNEAVRRLNALLGEKNQAQLLRTLATVDAASTRIGEIAVKVQPALQGVAPLTDDARKALAAAETLFANMNRLTHELAQRLDALERIAKSAEEFGSAARSVTGAMTADTLPRINAVVDELARSARNLDRLLTELNEHPASLVFGRPQAPPGPGEAGFDPKRGGGK